MDNYTEVSSQSWLGRIGGAMKGILVGLLLFIAAFPLLFWNEGRAVERYKTLLEGEGAVVSISSSEWDSSADGKLVHTTGRATPQGDLTDPQFQISAIAIKLQRKVEMYQWQESTESEERKKLGGGTETVTTYSYRKGWSSRHTSSANFRHPEGHANPASMPYQGQEWSSDQVVLGAYRLPPFLVDELNDFTQLPVQEIGTLPFDLRSRAHLQGGGYYIGAQPGVPAIGDLRITFYSVGPTDISLVAQQTGDTFQPYQAEAGGTIALLETGTVKADAMFQSAHEGNRILTWLLRIAGLIVMTLGINMMVRPLSVLADVVPAVGSLVAAGTGIIAFLLAVVFSFVTIAIAWVFYRPLIGIGLLAVAGGALYLTRFRVKQKQPAPPPAPGHPAAPPPPPPAAA